MSTAPGPARSRALRSAVVTRPLTLVPHRPSHRPRTPFVVLIVALMGLGLVGLLMVNTAMQSRAFELSGLQDKADALDNREQALTLEVQRLSSPDRIAAHAARLGMVPSGAPAFLRVDDGKVLGHPRAALPGTNLPGLASDPDADAQAPDDTATHKNGDDKKSKQDEKSKQDKKQEDKSKQDKKNSDKKNDEKSKQDKKQDDKAKHDNKQDKNNDGSANGGERR